ncbi:MAG: dihydropteroate synthase [Burkholderiales bacterium]|nr:dihydropteroate synthase [Burkholderiales bacterium]
MRDSSFTSKTSPIWQCGRYTLDTSRPLVMGILNLTPDSFSDGGQFIKPELAVQRALQMIADGADIIDIGGESTRPNAPKVSCCEELCRILPVIDALVDCGVPISVDTCKPYVMRETLKLGVDIINDIDGFNNPVSIDAVADSHCGLCVMHMQGTPQTMQDEPHYDDVVTEVAKFLAQQVQRLSLAGVARERICLDAGFGFGKNLAHNHALMRGLRQLQGASTLPMLVGVSRKRMIGAITGREAPTERIFGSVAAALWALNNGAHIVRVHDVRETVDAIRTWDFLNTP